MLFHLGVGNEAQFVLANLCVPPSLVEITAVLLSCHSGQRSEKAQLELRQLWDPLPGRIYCFNKEALVPYHGFK